MRVKITFYLDDDMEEEMADFCGVEPDELDAGDVGAKLQELAEEQCGGVLAVEDSQVL